MATMNKLTKLLEYSLAGEFAKLFAAVMEKIPPRICRRSNVYVFEKEMVSNALNRERFVDFENDP